MADQTEPHLADKRSYSSVEHEGGADAKAEGDEKPQDRGKKGGDKPQDGEGKDDGKDGDDKGKGDGKKKKGLLQRPVTLVIGLIVLVAAIVAAVLFWLNARHFTSSDDAFIDARIVHLAPQISGRVLAVHAEDNAPVHPGEVLVELDPADYQARLLQAQAQQAQAQGQLAQSRAQVTSAQAAIRVNSAQATQSRAQIAAQEAQVRAQAAQAMNAQRDYERYLGLQRLNKAAVAQQQVDQAQATFLNTAAQRDAAAAQVQAAADQARASLAQVRSAQTQVPQSQASVKAADANVKAAAAQVAQAMLNLSYSRLVSPVEGHVARRSVAVGNYLQAGTETMALVPDTIWITANFKETQLKNMRHGQPVDIRVDAYPGVKFHGHVDSIQRGAGQAFQVLPAENATGNYVKVVQRVPVKIVFDRPDPHYPLGPGMSVEPKVRVN